MKRLILLALTVLSSNLLSAQLLVTPGVGGAGISGSLVGPGLTVSGPVTINCSANAYGTFSNGLTTNLGVSNGIIMTTGSATTAIGPNNSGSDGICNGTSASDAQLLALDPLADQDVCVIGFDIIPQCNQLTIKFVFGSEEYPEWVSSGYNDAFGFFVTGPNPGGGNYSNFNIARLPNNSIVSIDNVNATTNNTYYVNNTGGTTIEYDGFTTVLTPVLNVTPCQTYHFKLAIADAGDCYYDSGVFIDILSCTNNVTASASATNPSCGLSNGSATVSTTNGIGPFSYSWNTSPVQTTQTATGLAPGTYTVTVTDLGAPCGTPATASVTLTNTGGGQPTTSVSPSSTTICQGSSVNLTASGATTYSWSPSTGLSASTGATVTATPSSTITYTVTGTNSCGSVTATTTVTVTPTPNVTATPSSQSICSGSATNIALSGTVPGTTYSWTVTQSGVSGASAGSGSSITQTLTATGGVAGTAVYTITPMNGSCPGTPITVTVTVNPLPTATAGSNSPVCVGSTINLTSNTVTGASYSWTGPNGFTNSNEDPSITSATTAMSGVYTVTITANGCSSTSTVSVNVTALPVATAGSNSPVCAGSSINLTANTVAGTYSWTGPNGFTSTTEDPTIANATTAMSGTYTVTITSGGCTSLPSTVSVTVNAAPVVTPGSNTPVCIGQTIDLSSNTISGATYSWTGPNGFTSPNEDPSISNATLAMSGTYTVVVTANGCSSTATVSVTVTNAADATITATSPICSNGSPITLTAATAGGTWSGTGVNTTTGVFDPSVSGAGSFVITYTLSGLCGSSDTETVTVNSTPTATAGTNSPVCEGLTLNLTANTVAGATYAWNGPNGFSSSTQDPSIANATTAASGTYTVTITANGCSSTSTISATVNPTPVANAGNDAFICQGSSITLNGSGTGTYSWSPSTGLSSTTISNPVATPATTISYILTVNGGGCTDSDTVLVTVSPTPTLTISNDTTICIGECATLNVSGADFYSWTPGTGLTDSTASGQTVCPATTTTYTVTGYTVSNNSVNNGDFSSGNTGFTSDYIFTNNTQPEGTYYVATDASISHPSFVGSDHTTGTGNFMIVNGSGTPNSSVWCQTISVQPNTDYVFSTWVSTLAPGSPALLQFSINGTALGTPFQAPAGTNQWIEFYTTWNSGASTTAVICIVNQNTTLGGNDFGLDDIFFSAICSATEQVTVTVNPPQDATITQQSPLCADAAAVQLSAVDGGGTWSGNGVSSGGSFNPANASIGNNIITYSIPGSCGDVDTMTIVVNALPTANAGADQILPCNPNQVNLNGTGSSSGNGITYQWTGGTISAGSTTTTPTVTASGTYTLVVTDANGCVASDVVVVNNATPPVASFTATPTSGTIPLVVNTTNTSTGTGLIYLWDNGLGQTSTASEPSFTYTVPGNPDLMLIVTDANGCVDTAWTVLTLYEEYELIIPNVFSPNGDGANDEFEIIHKGISMIHVSIYNRWGVFMTGYDGITQNWDGKKDNKLAPDGTYFYIIKVTKVTGEELEFNGTVTLMK